MEDLKLPESLYEDYTTYAPLSAKDVPAQSSLTPSSFSTVAPPRNNVGVIGSPLSFIGSSSCITAPPRNNVGVIGQAPSSFTASSSNSNDPPRNIFGAIGRRSSFTTYERVQIEQFINFLNQPHTRTNAISELCNVIMTHKEREPDLGLLLGNSKGTTYSLLQEILSVSRLQISMEESERICSALLLIKCIASHPDTKIAIIQAHIPVYFYPLINTNNRFNNMRFSGLAIIAQLLKEPGPHTGEIVEYLLKIETVPVCLPCLIDGCERTKALAAFVLGNILEQNEGKAYFGSFPERFSVISSCLYKVVNDFEGIPLPALLKCILICYRELAETPRCREMLMKYYPVRLRDLAYLNFACDNTTRSLANQVLRSLIADSQDSTFFMDQWKTNS